MSMDFIGAKAALVRDGHILTYLRDDKPGLPWAGWWDLPGGGREGSESAETCLLREVNEEFGLCLPPDRLIWRRVFPSMEDSSQNSVFFVANLSAAEITAIRFGDEGQYWEMTSIAAFLRHAKAIPEMQRRVDIALAELGPAVTA